LIVDSTKPIEEKIVSVTISNHIKFQLALKDVAKGIPTTAAFKYIGNHIENHPNQRCDTLNQCIERVRSGLNVYIMASINFNTNKNYVLLFFWLKHNTTIDSLFAQDYRTILNLIGSDLKKTGRCYFTIAKEHFTFAMAGIILPKNSPYTEEMSKS